MNIKQKDIKDNILEIIIEIPENDVNSKVEKKIKKYRNNFNLKGFRKGKVPIKIIRNQYYESFKNEIINELLNEEITKYIKDTKLQILGTPIPINNKYCTNDNIYIFEFQVGLVPNIKIDLEKISINKYEINISQNTIDNYIEYLKLKYGTYEIIEEVRLKSFIDIITYDIEQNPYEQTLYINNDLNMLIGNKLHDNIQIECKNLVKNNLKSNFRFNNFKSKNSKLNCKITKIYEIKEDIFTLLKKIYNNENNEILFDLLKKDLNKIFKDKATIKFINDAFNEILKKIEFNLPKSYLIKLLLLNNKDLNNQDAEKNIEFYENDLKKEIIKNNIKDNYNIKLEDNDIKEYITSIISKDNENLDLSKVINTIKEDKNQYNNIINQIFLHKISKIFEKYSQIKIVNINSDEFDNL